MRTPGERTSGAWTGGCVIHPDGGDETDRTAGNSYTATPHNTQGARKTLKYMADNGLIATASEGSDSKQRYSVKRRFDGRSCRFVEFKIGQFSEKDDDIESEADKYEQESFTDSDGFMSITEGMEEELPFK